MSKRARRILVPLAVLVIAALVVLAAVLTPGRSRPEVTSAAEQPAAPNGAESPRRPVAKPAEARVETVDAADAVDPIDPDLEPVVSPEAIALTGLRAVAPETGVAGFDAPPQALGSLDPRVDELLVELSRVGAGIERITPSGFWRTAAARRQAQAHYRALESAASTAKTPALPPDEQRYVLQTAGTLSGITVPVLAAHSIIIGDQWVPLFDSSRDEAGRTIYVWSETAPGRFETRVHNDQGQPVLHIVRAWTLRDDSYGLDLQQAVMNLSGQPLDIQWVQYGPAEMPDDRSPYIDPRRFRFGYLLSREVDPNELGGVNPAPDMMLMRSDVHGLVEDNLPTLWPNREANEEGYRLSWFASESRYFAIAVHAPYDPPKHEDHAITDSVVKINAVADYDAAKGRLDEVFTELYSPVKTIASGATATFDMGVFAGPLDADILGKRQPYRSLNMQGMILYQMSNWCAFCTFQWLAHLLLWFLALIEGEVISIAGVGIGLHDWALAIILLVIVVRTLLHPITKRSQISMQRFGRAMQGMKPELDKLQQKYANEPKKIQQEQIRLMREHGVSPLGCLGFLPLILQTPIWIALYAMLFFAIELRHEPAFYGVFQLFGGWPFLADLSSPDLFIAFTGEGVRLPWFWGDGFLIRGFNLLPILMGLVFFIQQKYMTPPPAATMSEDQVRQQKIMKVMMVVLFPIMLYNAPSGLTLYIMTSSCLGILESRYIRRHIEELDKNPPKPGDKPATPWWMQKVGGKPKDPQSRAFAAAIDRAKSKRQQRQQKSFKKRK